MSATFHLKKGKEDKGDENYGNYQFFYQGKIDYHALCWTGKMFGILF